MSIINFNEFKASKERKEMKIRNFYNKINNIYNTVELTGFKDLDDISYFLENELGEDFLEIDYDVSLSESLKEKVKILFKYLNKNMDEYLELSKEGIHLFHKNEKEKNEILFSIYNLALEIECKVYQFNSFINAYQTRCKKA